MTAIASFLLLIYSGFKVAMEGFRFIICTYCCALLWEILVYAESEEIFLDNCRVKREIGNAFRTKVTVQSPDRCL